MGAARHALTALLLPIAIGLPVAAGLGTVLLQAFGVTPGLAGGGVSLAAWSALAEWPGVWGSVSLTVRTGVAATALSTVGALLIGLGGRAWMGRATAPLLAIPHAALSIGLAFLIAPTGWLVRLAGMPPLPFSTVGEGSGGAMIVALCLKETPFLLLCVMSALGQSDADRSRVAAASLGYAPLRSALFVVLPRIWPQVRLPVLAVLAFSLSVTDVALILGPQTPPTLAIRILRWSTDPDLSRGRLAAAASVLLMALMVAGFAALLAVERLAAAIGRRVAERGGRGAAAPDAAAAVLLGPVTILGYGALAALVLWAGAGAWRYPAVLPTGWASLTLFERLGAVESPALTTFWLGAATALLALAIAVVVLQAGAGRERPGIGLAWVPLLLPQAGFLFGVQILLVAARLDGSAFALIWAHGLFVLPYVLLALRGPWRALDARYGRVGASVGASPWRVLWRITLPLLASPLLTAAAIGFGVSATLYLPTLFAGAGRFPTLATEAVSLAAGADRRLAAAAALAQALLPALMFAAVLAMRPRP